MSAPLLLFDLPWLLYRAHFALPSSIKGADGEPIGADVVQMLNNAYEANTVREPWQAGDLLLVDNVRTAHSREAFTGPREILVGMSDR